MNEWIKTARSAVSKNPRFFLRRQPRNFENTTLVARRRKHFWVFLAIFLVAQISPKRGLLVHKNSLASCQRYRHSVEPRALTCPFKHSDLIAWSLLSGHPTHKYLWGRLSVLSTFVVCSPSSRSRRPRLGLFQRKRFSQKWFRLRFCGVHEHLAVALRNSWKR